MASAQFAVDLSMGSHKITDVSDPTNPQDADTKAARDAATALAIPKSLIDAKGDLIAGTADNTPARLAVGTDGQVLTADAASTPGVKWADASGGSTSFGLETPSGTVNGINDTFTLSAAPDPAADLLLFKNGLLMKAGGVDYTLTTATVVFVASQIPPTGSILLAAIPTSGGGGGSGAGTEINYTQITSPVNITDTSESTATAIISPGAITFDGDPVLFEFFAPYVQGPSTVGGQANVTLFEGATQIARLGSRSSQAANGNFDPWRLAYRFTPSAGSHTYTLCAFANSTTGTPAIGAGAGGTAAYSPAFVRFTKV